ncbi:MAG: U32 family peptidase [Mycoplasmoidaceae bacterium]
MKIAIKCDDLEMAKKLIDRKADLLYFGINNFSCRFNKYIDLETLKKIVSIKKDSKISVVLNNLYSEEEIPMLENLLTNLSEIDIDELCFHDYAILQICYEKEIKFKFHYNPETLNTNYGQLDFFRKNNIEKISLAREMTKLEIKKILEDKENIEIEIQAHGFTFFMHSKWPMVSNFKKYLELKKQKLDKLNYLVIQEEKRKMPNLIQEDQTGTHMYSGFTLCIYDLIPELNGFKLDSILIDNIFRDENWTLKVFDIYKKIVTNMEINEKDLKQLENLENEFPISKSFLGNFKEMPQMEKEDYED